MADDGYQAGTAYTQVLPDFRNFHKKITAALKGESEQFEEFGDKAGKYFVNGFSERLEAGFEKLPVAKVKVKADVDKATEEIDKAARDRKAKVTLSVVADKLKGHGIGGKDLLGALGLAVGPQAVALGAVGAGTGLAAGAGLAGLGAFALVAKGEVTKVQAAQKAFGTAQKQFETAQASYASATTKAGKNSALAAEAKALAAEKAALKGLTPAEQQLGRQITGLSDAWSKLGAAESPVVAKALTPWVATATSGMRLLAPLVDNTGAALEGLGQKADKAIQSPFWDDFATELGATAGQSVYAFGDALGHVADAGAHLVKDFLPDVAELPDDIDHWAASFDNWARSYNKSGFERFISKTLSSGNIATLKSDAEDIGSILGNVAKATQGFSPTAFTGLSNVLDILAKLSPGQIEAVAGLYAAARVAGTASQGASAISGIVGTFGGKGKKPKAGKPAAEGEEPSGGGVGIGGVVAAATIIPAAEAALPAPDVSWLNSWAPYEKIFTNDLPKAWSISYEAFQLEFAGPMTAWFTQSLPHFFTAQVPMAWSVSYEAFQLEFAGKITSWFTVSLPHFFAASGTWLAGAGRSMAGGLASGWDSAEGGVTGAFRQAQHWAGVAVASSASWLTGAGNRTAGGFVHGWDSAEGGVTRAAGAVKSWVVSGVGDLRGLLTGAGEAAMSGFLGGLRAGWNDVTGFVGGIASWISAHKGPVSYDATLLIPHGRATMGSFYQGLLQGYRPVQSLISGIAPAIAGAPSLPGVGRPLSGGGAAAITFRYVPSGNALGDAVVSHLQLAIQGMNGGDVQGALGRGRVRA